MFSFLDSWVIHLWTVQSRGKHIILRQMIGRGKTDGCRVTQIDIQEPGIVRSTFVGHICGGRTEGKEKEDNDWMIRKDADPFPGERGSGQFAKPPGDQ